MFVWDMDKDESVHDVFDRSLETFLVRQWGLDDDGVCGVNDGSSIDHFYAMARKAEALGLISDNEVLDDVTSKDLKFALLPYILAELHYSAPGIGARRVINLRTAMFFWTSFINLIQQLEIPTRCEFADALKGWEDCGLGDAAKHRRSKIDRLRLGEDLDTRLRTLRHKGRGGRNKAVEDTDIEEIDRDATLVAIHRAALSSVDQFAAAKAELPLAERMASERDGENAGSNATTEPQAPPRLTQGVDAAQLRLMYKEQVFQRPCNKPTVSLAEVAKWEMDMEINKIGARGPACPLGEDEQEAKDRKWDDWKDDNPKGGGNTRHNRG
eukprot:Polyplicarium_translucidae@DN3381_c2_g1_i24.p1